MGLQHSQQLHLGLNRPSWLSGPWGNGGLEKWIISDFHSPWTETGSHHRASEKLGLPDSLLGLSAAPVENTAVKSNTYTFPVWTGLPWASSDSGCPWSEGKSLLEPMAFFLTAVREFEEPAPAAEPHPKTDRVLRLAWPASHLVDSLWTWKKKKGWFPS